MARGEAESPEEKESRLTIIRFLGINEGVLDRVLGEITKANPADLERIRILHRLWESAKASLRRVVQSIQIGLSRVRRDALIQVGMFFEDLKDKLSLLEFDIKEAAIHRVLKRLNSMLGSLAKVFPALHVVKELKEHAEATMDALKQPLNFITMSDLLEN
jgi:hypothetical protein